MADEDRDETITRAELDELRDGFAELTAAVRELREARTPDERREARADVREAEEDLDATAKRLGVSRAKLEESIAAAKKAERREELRPIVTELLDELRAENDDEKPDEGDGAAGTAGAGKGGKPDATGKGSSRRRSTSSSSNGGGDDDGANPPVVDTEPVVPHWSERGVGGLIR